MVAMVLASLAAAAEPVDVAEPDWVVVEPRVRPEAADLALVVPWVETWGMDSTVVMVATAVGEMVVVVRAPASPAMVAAAELDSAAAVDWALGALAVDVAAMAQPEEPVDWEAAMEAGLDSAEMAAAAKAVGAKAVATVDLLEGGRMASGLMVKVALAEGVRAAEEVVKAGETAQVGLGMEVAAGRGQVAEVGWALASSVMAREVARGPEAPQEVAVMVEAVRVVAAMEEPAGSLARLVVPVVLAVDSVGGLG